MLDVEFYLARARSNGGKEVFLKYREFPNSADLFDANDFGMDETILER